jgi:hypothetical protein
MRTLAVIVLAGFPSLLFAQASRVEGWRIVADAGAPDSVRHDRMPPGWHITTGPAAILFDPSIQARARFAVEAEIHLFPGESSEGYGVFLGGSDLSTSAGTWTAFLITKDGDAVVERRSNNTTAVLHPRSRAVGVKAHEGGSGTALNVIRVLVQGDSAVFSANGQRIVAIPTANLRLDGPIGFRVGKGLNLHISNLDLTTRLAPFPVRR